MYYLLASPQVGGTLAWTVLPPSEFHPLDGLIISFCGLSLSSVPRYLGRDPWIDPTTWTFDLDAMQQAPTWQDLPAVPWLTGKHRGHLTKHPPVIYEQCPERPLYSFLITV
jgi:hypothetical protein